MIITEPGVYDLPENEYHGDPLIHLGGSLSSTLARHLLPPSCPLLARHEQLNPVSKDEYDLGSVTHGLILGKGPKILEVPANTWATKAANDMRREAREAGMAPILTKDLNRALAMSEQVHADPLAHALLTLPGVPERTLVWREGDVWGRAMLDRWPDPSIAGDPIRPEDGGEPPTIVDVKTTGKRVDERSVIRSIWDFGYYQQAEWYLRGYHAVHGLWPDFVFVFVMTAPPHLTRCVRLTEDYLDKGRERNDQALAVWRRCMETGEWPGYEPADDFLTVGAPPWAE